ncbi:hypothetical protein ESCO_003209 [Escovopsis weberi]|uniref:Folliculin-interacting protein N-terminal domain-containing protein n=1 Tax=Escovopsis weberi TaxID=150374 RepID=A0A0M9VS83_ESCWE|nr:hypothetical protein ESCO_003209 [Escovopsis weberi]
MLGRLLHLGSGSQPSAHALPHNIASQPILSLESVQEDIHTRNLLFPDAHALYQHRHDQVFPLSTAPATPSTSFVHAFDLTDDIDLDLKDVRVIIMQDALGPTNASLLYDSHPLTTEDRHDTERPATLSDLKKGAPPPRKGSIHGQVPRPTALYHGDVPQARQGAFDRRASVNGRTPSFAETDVQKAAREYREELATFSSCIFGNSELMAYKGTSTKVHVVPCEPRAAPDHPHGNLGDGRSSIGRSSGRSSKLSQSFSSQTVSPPPFPTALVPPPRHSDRKKVLITRLFPVTLTTEDLEASDATPTPPGRFSEDNSSFPFPLTGDESVPKKKRPQPKQRRTPMYAVVLVVQLPPNTSRTSSAVPPKPAFRESGSYNDPDMFPSSYNSTRMLGWHMAGAGLYGEPVDSSFSIDVEDRIDSLTQHWDIIMRTLTHLQSVVASTLHSMLKLADIASSPGLANPASSSLARTPAPAERRNDVRRAKPPKSTIKLVYLLPNCLADEAEIASEVDLSRSRIIIGLSAARVITGQGRWGIWRDEAIWTCRWGASKGQHPFFHTLLTGFLATQTDWLQALCHTADRRRALFQRQARNEDDLSLPARTIIVSDDKMAARRIIFLLSAFLPTNQQLPGARAHRPSTSASLATFSNSPPSYVVPVLREESLRRKINRRTGWRRASHSRAASQCNKMTAVTSHASQLSMEHPGQRRASDAASIRTTSLPIPGNDLVSRKSIPATATAVLQETTTPHFTSVQRSDGQVRTRPGSSSSVAADDLKRSLKRGESSGASCGRPTSQGMKWGNVISGLWNQHRRESMDSGSGYSQAGGDLRSPIKATFGRPDKLSEMVREVSSAEEAEADRRSAQPTSAARDVGFGRESAERKRRSFHQLDRTPDPTGAFESPVKTSINADDGVIDVDVPFPDYIASFESAISSPSSSGYLSTPGLPGLDSFEQSGRITIDGDLPLNVAGWLHRFHPDFAMQAIPPQADLVDKVKAALRAEPTPPPMPQPSGEDDTERWVDVGSALIADTINNTVKRINYRRLVKVTANTDKAARPGHVLTPSNSPDEALLDEKWIEETVASPDELLAEALDRVVNLSSDARRDSPVTPHHPHAYDSGNVDRTAAARDTLSEVTQMADPLLDIPRVQCKTVILSALEETIREIIDQHDEEDADESDFRKKGRYPSLLRDAVKQWADSLDSGE